MIAGADSLHRRHFLFSLIPTITFILPRKLLQTCRRFSSSVSDQLLPTLEQDDPARDAIDVFRRFGCTDAEISTIFLRRQALKNYKINLLESRLETLRRIGFGGRDLIKIITCRPRVLSCHFEAGLDQRLTFLSSLFGSQEKFLKAIVRNPSLLNYDTEKWIKPCLALYESVGVSKKDVANLLPIRPTIICRSSLDEEKLRFIHETGLSHNDKLYKYVVSIVAVSRIQTLREKVSHLEKFGISFGEVMKFMGRCPVVLTLSVERVHRHMVFVVGTLKLPANAVVMHPFLLTSSLDAMLKPRQLLLEKIHVLGLSPRIKGPKKTTVLRMEEARFVEAFIKCHEGSIARVLMDFYSNAKGSKRLAQGSKVVETKGFPL